MKRSALFFFAVAAGAALLTTAMPASALQIYVDQTASYRYINATGPDLPVPANWFSVGFDDSTWNTGNGPFSSNATSSTILNQANVNAPFAPGPTQPTPASFTQWDINHDPLLRTTFSLAAPTALTIWIAVDNGVGVLGSGAAGLYVNGVQTTQSVNAEGNAFRWESVFNIPAQYTFAGANLIALQLEDHGGLTGFDMVVTAASPDTSIPPFTTNPPPTVPEASSWATIMAGLGLLAAIARRRIAA